MIALLKNCFLGFLTSLPLNFAGICTAGAEEKQPNILLLFSDDAGYADFGFQGSRHFKTPNLDKLAKSGILFSEFYVTAAVCGPSRAGLLTGKYQQRFGFEENNVPGYMSESGLTGEDMGLPLGIPTIADHLKKLGYRTAIFDKWHMGDADRYHPLKRGFDEFYGFRGGARNYYAYPDDAATEKGKLIERGFGEFVEHEGYLTDRLADETCDFMQRNKEKPFFAYVSFNAVHSPMDIDPGDAKEFPQLEGRRRKVAQMTLSLDRACGQILAKLDELGLREDTLIIFTNDNGGPTDSNSSSNYPLSGTKATHLEGGIRVPGIMSWKGRLEAGSTFKNPVSTLDFLPTFVALGGGNPAGIEGLDGVDLMPFLTGQNTALPHETLFWKKECRGTIRKGDWKLLRFPDRPAELYNIAADPSEDNNLADANPEKVRTMFKELFAWEAELERPLWQLKRSYEKQAMERLDEYRKQEP
ncbi:sulfatase-like hydrolase/transferase [Luteolibacter algae]|uniref:Sulfatase-like hydrolase/transferase n=1 Tax=Luteolibacter algae TaxID=454151 RepID=A0ABW5D494_9BACT